MSRPTRRTLTVSWPAVLAVATVHDRTVVSGEFIVTAPVRVVFSHQPDTYIDATAGTKIPIPTGGTINAGEPWTITVSSGVRVTLWWNLEVVSEPAFQIDPTITTPPTPPTPPAPTPTSVLTSVSLTSASIMVGGTSFAVALDQNGKIMSDVTWTVGSPTVASIVEGGGLTALAEGTTTVSATIGTVTRGAVLTVTANVPPPPVPVPVITTVTIVPATIDLSAGATATATARDQFGTVLEVGLTWVSSAPSVADVGDSSGLITGISAGTATITGTHNGVSVSALLTVAAAPPPPPVTPVLVRPVTSDVIAPSFVAELTFAAAGPTSASFELRTTGGALVQAWAFTFPNTTTQLVQTLQITNPIAGTYDVVGLVAGITTSAARVTLSVPAPPSPSPAVLTTVTLNPFSIVVGGTALALAKDQNGQALTVTWSSNNTALATVASNGTVTALSAGTVQITATYNGAIVSAALVITAPVVPPVPPGSKRLLTVADIRYLGALRFPNGTNLDFSYGAMTGRRVNGQVRLLLLGSLTLSDPLYEFADPGVYSLNPATAPAATLVRAWGNIYGNARRTWYANGTEKLGYPRYMGSLRWVESTQLLYWTYYDTYNTTGDQDWSLGATALNTSGPVAYGPWRVAGPAGSGPNGVWKCVRITEHPTSGELLCGGVIASGNASSPWGPNFWAGQWPTAATPAGYGNPDLPVQKYLTYPSMIGRVNHDGSWSGALTSSRRPGDYFFEPIVGGGVFTEIDPTKNNGVGSWTQVDAFGGAEWIEGPSAHGVLCFGKLGAGHIWYRNAGVGNDLCTHGVASPVNITGPVSTDAYPFAMIFDPADLAAVRAGTKTAYTVDPVQTINLQTTYGIQTSLITHIGSAKLVAGSYFDPTTGKLYVCAPEADTSVVGIFTPLVHVFQVTS